jgi:LysM repeat protein
MDGRRRSPARLLAPISLVAFALALLIVIAGSGTDDDSDDNGNGGNSGDRVTQTETTPGTTTTTDTTEPRVTGTFYTVKTGDTLGGIAETVGVSVTRLQELNPELDPQALVAGQKIRLRE